jgi:hypothetical protein
MLENAYRKLCENLGQFSIQLVIIENPIAFNMKAKADIVYDGLK